MTDKLALLIRYDYFWEPVIFIEIIYKISYDYFGLNIRKVFKNYIFFKPIYNNYIIRKSVTKKNLVIKSIKISR